LVTVHVSHP